MRAVSPVAKSHAIVMTHADQKEYFSDSINGSQEVAKRPMETYSRVPMRIHSPGDVLCHWGYRFKIRHA